MRCSVAMSTYNGSAFLTKQLDSILSQTCPVNEIVISDDASTDQTLNIIHEYQRANPNISWKVLTSEQNQGFRSSFRRAIANCGGDLIFLCDQDDIWLPGKIEVMKRHFLENPEILTLISDFKTIDAQDRLLNAQTECENIWVSDRVLHAAQQHPARISLREMLGRNQGQGCTMALRREIALEYIALEKLWTHDWIINLIAAMHGGLYYCREQLIHYRLHGANVIGMAQGEHAQRSVSFPRKLYEFLLACKYSLLQEDGDKCRDNLISVTMDKYEFVFEHVACCADEIINLKAWKSFQTKRLTLIKQKKLFQYLLFWLKNRTFFAENTYFSTFEQFAIRFMMDLCAIIK